MKTIGLFTTCCLLILASVTLWGENRKTIKGSGNIKTETRSVSSFNEISVSNAITLYLSQENKISVKVEGDDNLLQYVQTESKGGELKIYINNEIQTKGCDIKVYVSAPELEELDATTAARVKGTTPWKVNNLDISATTAADIELEVAAGELEVTGTTAASINLSGSCDKLDASFTTAASLNANELTAREAKVKGSTAASLKVNVSETITYKMNTGSSLVYKGDARSIESSTDTGGSAKKK